MSEPSSVLKRAFGVDKIEEQLSEQRSLFLARFDDLDRQIRHLVESLAYANHQLLELREKVETIENTVKQPVEHRTRKSNLPEMNEVEEKVLQVVKKSGQISAAETSLLSGLSRTRASEILNGLARKSIVSKEKRGRISFFILSSDVSGKLQQPKGGGADSEK